MRHPFIVFEGVDGAGKSEISARVAAKLGAIHIESPGEPFKQIRGYVDDNLNGKGRFLFYLSSNLDLSRCIREKTESETIVCARYFFSTIIGYASREGLSVEKLYESLPVSSDDFLKPDLTIFLYVNEDVQRSRINLRDSSDNSAGDYKCIEDQHYRKMLFDNYIYVSEKESWSCIDTSLMSIDEVVDTCVERILNR